MSVLSGDNMKFSILPTVRNNKKTFTFFTREIHLPRVMCSRRGCNTMYLETNRINYFLIEMHELADIPNLSTPTHFNIYTNRKNPVSHQVKHISTSVTPNVKYVISKFLMHFFTTQRHLIPKTTFHRVFSWLQSLLLSKYQAIYDRFSSTKNSNKRTKTIIKF